jgi:hypothetical protein
MREEPNKSWFDIHHRRHTSLIRNGRKPWIFSLSSRPISKRRREAHGNRREWANCRTIGDV